MLSVIFNFCLKNNRQNDCGSFLCIFYLIFFKMIFRKKKLSRSHTAVSFCYLDSLINLTYYLGLISAIIFQNIDLFDDFTNKN